MSTFFSFAAITAEPLLEVAAAGHDRCIIPIMPENIDAWLAPTRTIWLCSTQSSMTGHGRITNTKWQGERPSYTYLETLRH